MKAEHLTTLQKLGLAPTEAQVYLSLARVGGSLSASGIVAATGVARGTIYPTLNSLVDKGIVQNGEGYGSKFAALPPEEALPRLIAAEKEKLSESESLTATLIKELQATADQKENGSDAKLIEVLRDPRVCSERFQKLQLEAEREVDVLVKLPIIARIRSNPAESQSLHSGIKHRAIYDSSVLEDENIAPYLEGWIEAGEEAREYRKGELPLKLVLFDTKIAWIPLQTNALRHPIVSVLIRHQALAKALRLLFEYLWQESEPIRLGVKRACKGAPANSKASRSKK